MALKTNVVPITPENIEEHPQAIGFIEHVPGEYCRRRVDAKGYLFIHCLSTNGKKYRHQGLGRALLDEVERQAAGTPGVEVMTSDKSFMADRKKTGAFRLAARGDDRYGKDKDRNK